MTDIWNGILNHIAYDTNDHEGRSGSGYRMIHFIRSPIDTIISGYLYHRKDQTEEAANDLIQDAKYRRVRLVPASIINHNHMDDQSLDLGYEFSQRWNEMFRMNHFNGTGEGGDSHDEFDPSSLSEQVKKKVSVWAKLKYILKPDMKWLPNFSQLQCLILPSSFVSSYIHSNHESVHHHHSMLESSMKSSSNIPNLYNPYLSQLIYRNTTFGDLLREISEQIINHKNRLSMHSLYNVWADKDGLLLEFLRFFNCEFSSQLTSLISRCHLHSLFGPLYNTNINVQSNKNKQILRNSVCDANSLVNNILRIDMDQDNYFNQTMNDILDYFNLEVENENNLKQVEKMFGLDDEDSAREYIQDARDLIINKITSYADINANRTRAKIRENHINDDEGLKEELRSLLVTGFGIDFCQFLKKVTLIMEFEWKYSHAC